MVLEQQATGICLKEGTMERIPRPTSLSDFKETEVLKKKRFIFVLCVWMLGLYVLGVHRGQKSISDSLDMELKRAMSPHTCSGNQARLCCNSNQ